MKGLDPEDESHYTYKLIRKKDVTKEMGIAAETTPMTPMPDDEVNKH